MATWMRFGRLTAGAAVLAGSIGCATMRTIPTEAIEQAAATGIELALDRIPDRPGKPSSDQLQFDPPIVTFGVASTSAMTRTVVAKNSTDRVIRVASATVSGPRFALVEPVTAQTLFPGDTFEFQIRCATAAGTTPRGKVTFAFEGAHPPQVLEIQAAK